MSNKKKRNSEKRAKKMLQTHTLERDQVTVLGQAFSLIFGIGVNFGSYKTYKLRKFLTAWMAKGNFIKIGTVFVIKKSVALIILLSGFAFIFGFYRKRKSLVPIAHSQKDIVIVYPGLFKKQIEITKSEISSIKYKERKYNIKFWVLTKSHDEPITFKLSVFDKKCEEILVFFKAHVFGGFIKNET